VNSLGVAAPAHDVETEALPADAARRTQRRVWIVSFVSYLALISAWVLATPISASPDEPEHVHRAAAVVRGELLGYQSEPGGRLLVTAPQGVVSPSKSRLCFAFMPQVTADCAAPLEGGSELVAARSEAGRYNPVYYAFVGLPSLPFPNETGIYLMRLLSGALCAGLLASALTSAFAWRRSRLLVLGMLACVTPMVLFLSATVNPSAPEIAAAICLWASGLVAAVTPVGTALTPVLLRRIGIAAAILVVTRQLSPLWLALIAAVLLLVAGRRRIRALVARRDTLVWALLVFLATCYAVGWIVLAGSLGGDPGDKPERTLEDGIKRSILLTPARVTQMIGVLGWLDTRLPWFTYVAFAGVIGVVVVLGLAASKRRGQALILGVLAMTVLVPILIEGSQASRVGFIWQGRYTLPLAVGLPLAATLAAGLRGLVPEALTRNLAVWLAALVGLAQFGAFAYALLRYQVGVGGGYDLLAGSWEPPGGSFAVLLLFGVSLAVNLAVLVALTHRGATPPVRTGPQDRLPFEGQQERGTPAARRQLR
jgi:hypothetical protein